MDRVPTDLITHARVEEARQFACLSKSDKGLINLIQWAQQRTDDEDSHRLGGVEFIFDRAIMQEYDGYYGGLTESGEPTS
jgi:hypothetical protein